MHIMLILLSELLAADASFSTFGRGAKSPCFRGQWKYLWVSVLVCVMMMQHDIPLGACCRACYCLWAAHLENNTIYGRTLHLSLIV